MSEQNSNQTLPDRMTPEQMGLSGIAQTANAVKGIANDTTNTLKALPDRLKPEEMGVVAKDIQQKQFKAGDYSSIQPKAPDLSLPTIANILGNVGGDMMAGPEAGPIVGAAARVGTGTLANYITNLMANPETRKHPLTEFFNSLFSNVGQEIVGQGAQEAGQAAKKALINKVAPNMLSDSDRALVQSTPDDVPLTMGDVTGNRKAKELAAKFSPEQLINSKRQQQEYGLSAGTLGPGRVNYDPDQGPAIFEQAKQSALNNEKQMAASLKQAEQDFDKTANTQPFTTFRKQIDPATGQTVKVPIASPISLQASKPIAVQAQAMMNQMLPNASAVEGPIKPVYDIMAQISNELQGVTNKGQFTSPAIEYRRVEALHQAIQKGIRALEDPDNVLTPSTRDSFDNFNGTLKKLDTAIQSDLDTSIQKWKGQPGQPSPYQQYQNMENLRIQKLNAFDPEKAQNLLLGGRSIDGTYHDIADRALSSADSVRKWVAATGDRDSIANLAIQRIQDKAYDPVSGKIDPAKALRELNSPNNGGAYAEAIPSTQRSNLQEFYKRMTLLPEAQQMSTNQNFMMWHGTHLGFMVPGVIGGAALGAASHGTTGALIAGAGTMGAIYGIEKYLGNLMANPQIARAMINGTRIPAASGASNALSKVMMLGLKGATGLFIQDLNIPGRMIPIRIDQQGRPVPDEQ